MNMMINFAGVGLSVGRLARALFIFPATTLHDTPGRGRGFSTGVAPARPGWILVACFVVTLTSVSQEL
jgi:hypothetical protein